MNNHLERHLSNYEFKQSYRKHRKKLGFGKVRAGSRGYPYSLFLFRQQAKGKKAGEFFSSQWVYVWKVTKGNFFNRFKMRRVR